MNATPETFAATLDQLSATALRIKRQRDEAVAVLRQIQHQLDPAHAAKVRALLADIEAHSTVAP